MARLNSLWIIFAILFTFHNVIVADYWSCNFSDGMCGFTDYAGENQSWIRTDKTSIPPSHDATCAKSYLNPRRFPIFKKPILNIPIENHDELDSGLSNSNPLKGLVIDRESISLDRKCFWLTTLQVSKSKGEQDFILFSPKQTKMKQDGCLRFSYYFFGLAPASFSVQLNQNQSTFGTTNLFVKMVPQSNRWANAQVLVPKQDSEYYFIFKAHLDAKYHDVVGLDDLSYTPYPCSPSANTDFESANQAWALNGAKIATGGNPIKDHTTNTIRGHFAISTSAQPSTLSAGILDLTRQFSISDEYSYCLKFYYQFVSDDPDTTSYIDVNVTGATFSEKRIKIDQIISDGLDNTWQLMSVNIPSYKRALGKNYTVQLSMYTSKSTKIGIDDIIVKDKYCQSVGDCDFESDFCGWTQSSYSNGIWIRSDGINSGSFKESPRVDHTTLTEKGFFLMIPNEFMDKSAYAKIKSPPLGNTGSVNRCFQFAYFAHTKKVNDSVLRVTVLDSTKSNNIIVSKIVNGTTYAYWSNFTIPFPEKMPKAYYIEITTMYSAKALLSDIALDDLKLAYSCDGHNFKPSTTTPIPYSERKWDCTFEYSCSGWKFDKNWRRTSFSKLDNSLGNSNPPRLDHTYNTHTGGYLLYMPQQVDQNTNGSTQIISVVNSTNITGQAHCFSFYYFDSSEVPVQLDIVVSKSYGTYIEKSIRPNNAERMWRRVRVDFQYISKAFNISLVLHASKEINASFALDDIKLLPGQCGHMEDYTYTMDAYEGMDLNKVSPLKGGIGTLVKPSFVKTIYPDAPKNDHTTGTGGYFLFMNKKKDYPGAVYKSEFVIDNLEKPPIVRAIKGRCIRFAYQAFGSVQLEVYVDSVDANYHNYPIFRTVANHSKWMMAQVTYSAYYKHKITFSMEKKYDIKSYVSLDDISFLASHCESPVQCDFDDDTCSYSSDYNSYNFVANYEFSRFVGPPLSREWPGPGYDHTKASYGGGYLALTGWPTKLKTKRTAQIQTPIMSMGYEKMTNSCFTIFTYLTAADAEVVIGVRFFAREGDSTEVKLLKLNGPESKWTRHYADIDGKLFKGKNEFIFTIEGTTQEVNSVIAIDDISYSSFECAYKHQFKCKNGDSIPMDKVCNFVADCKDSSDEQDCGSCDFENNGNLIDQVCGYHNGSDFLNSKLGGAWIPVQAGKNSNGPDHDGSMNKTGHYLLVQKSRFSDKNYPFISDTTLTRYYDNYQYQFKDAYLSCYMTFDAYITSQYPQSRARIQVWAGSDRDSSVIKLHVPVDPAIKEWSSYTAFIGGFPNSFIVEFRATELAQNETISLDNIAFQKCSFPPPIKGNSCPDERQILCNSTRICISPEDLCDGENNCGDGFDESYQICSPFKLPGVPVICAFEMSLDTCGMTLDNLTRAFINWELTRGFSYKFETYKIPSSDHTTKDKHGQFMTLYMPKNSKKKNVGKPVAMMSPMMTSDSQPCIARFFYYINGDIKNAAKNNELNVYVQYADGSEGVSDSLFHSNSYMANWIKGNARMQSKKPFRFVFSGVINDQKGSISIDDISYTDTCYNSDAVYKPGSPHHGGSAFLIIVLIVLCLAVIGGAFFAWRKHQAGDLSFDSVTSRVRSIIPGGKNPTAFENPHFNK